MLDGFNEGWIDFEGDQAGTIKGKVELHTVLQELDDAHDWWLAALKVRSERAAGKH
jgi:hypothetical protein